MKQFLLGLLVLLLIGVVAAAESEELGDLEKKAEQGDAKAQNSLAWMYAIGWGGTRDGVEALKWYRLAAEQGVAEAQYNLAGMYADGHGVTRDDVEALKWFRRAAEQGHAEAQYNLAVMYYNGQGALKDEIEAWAWFNMVAISGNKAAARNRDNLENRLGTQATLAAQRRSKELLKQIEAGKLKSEG